MWQETGWMLVDAVPRGQCHVGRLHLVAAMTAAAALLALAPAPHCLLTGQRPLGSRRLFMQMTISVQSQNYASACKTGSCSVVMGTDQCPPGCLLTVMSCCPVQHTVEDTMLPGRGVGQITAC